MKRSVLIQATVGIAVLSAILYGLFDRDPRSPAEILTSVQGMISLGEYDERSALRELDRAEAMAEKRGDELQRLQALSLRAEVLRKLGSLAEARSALEQLLEAMPDNARVKLRIARLLALQSQNERALENVREMLRLDPGLSEAWMLGGKLQRERAESFRTRAEETARGSLVLEQYSLARKWIGELAAREQADPERPSSGAKLSQVLRSKNEIAFEQVADFSDRASEDNRDARGCYARSFEGLAEPEAACALLEMWTAAGHAELASEFGMAAAHMPTLGGDPNFARALMLALSAADRGQDLSDFLGRWNWDTGGGDGAFYMGACRALLELESWRPLMRAADLLGKYGSVEHSQFFYGMALAGMQRGEDAIRKLDYFLDSEAGPPVPGARGIALLRIASANRELNRKREEREALERLDEGEDPISGEALLRLVELQVSGPYAASRIPEERWTRAMALLPRRTEELMPEWKRLGEISAREDGRDLGELVARMTSRREVLPSVDVGPWMLYQIGLAHLEGRRASSAVKVAQRLLDRYPGLLPAIDLAIQGQIQRDQMHDAAQRVLERLELVGRDARSVEFLKQIGTGHFTPGQLLLSMKADPSRTGRLAVGQYLLDHGQAERALRALEGGAVAEQRESRIEERVLAGRALFELGRNEEALERVAKLWTDPVFGVAALTVEFDASLAIGDERTLERLISRTVEAGTIHRDLFLSVIDHMLESGMAPLSRPLVELLDASPETRGGDLFLRQALLGAVTENREEALEGLSRAEAYLEDGMPELGRLLLAVGDHSWTLLPEMVSELRRVKFLASPFEEAVLAIFEERSQAAQALAESRLAESPERAEWAIVLAAAQLLQNKEVLLPVRFGERAASDMVRLLRGTQEAVRDPRLVLGLLVALDRPGWSKWAVPRLVELRTQGAGFVWPSYLTARAHLTLGDLDSANRTLTALVSRAPSFAPAWDVLIQLSVQAWGDPNHPRVVRLRKQRLDALPEELRGSPLQVAVDQASARALGGENQAAIADLERALTQADEEAARAAQAAAQAGEGAPQVPQVTEVAPPSPPSRLGHDLLARLYRDEGQYLKACAEYSRACEAISARSDQPLVAEFTYMLTSMTRRNPGEPVPQAPARARVEPAGEEPTTHLDPDAPELSAEAQAGATPSESAGHGESSEPGLLEVALTAIARLETRFPSDPLVALARARMEIVARPGDSTSTSRAIRVLNNFRRETKLAPLDQLRPGASEDWTTFLLTRSPETAQRFVEQDLTQTPGSIELWLALAKCLAARGQDREAIELYGKLVQMSNDAAAHYGLAFLLAKHGSDTATVEQHLRAAEAVDQESSGARSTLIRQVAELSSRRPNLGQILRSLEQLWVQRAEHVRELDSGEISRVFVRALVESGAEADFRQLSRLCAEMLRESDNGYRRDYYRALGGLAGQMEKHARAEARARERERALREARKAKGAAAQTPGTQTPGTQTPGTQTPGTETLDTGTPTTEPQPASESPTSTQPPGAGSGESAEEP